MKPVIVAIERQGPFMVSCKNRYGNAGFGRPPGNRHTALSRRFVGFPEGCLW